MACNIIELTLYMQKVTKDLKKLHIKKEYKIFSEENKRVI